MPAPAETIWPLEPHTRAKHEILRRYLEAWFPILATYHGRIVYVDGFCGPGRYSEGEPGSPIIALDTAINHRAKIESELVLIFIDSDSRCTDHLRSELDRRELAPSVKVFIRTGTFGETFTELLDKLDQTAGTIAPCFAFIDPFGYTGIPYNLVSRILKNARTEVLITIMGGPLQRFVGITNEAHRASVIETFGTPECIEISSQQGEETRVQALRALYQRQLQAAATFVRYFEMRDRRDRPVYDLFFASNHRLGHLKMKEAMWKVDRSGEFRFSDATAGQVELFQRDHAHSAAKLLRSRFASAGCVLSETCQEYIEDETPFLRTHMLQGLKTLEDAGRVLVDGLKVDGKPRKARTFPAGTRIYFTPPAD